MTVAQTQPVAPSGLDYLFSHKDQISQGVAAALIALTTQQVLNYVGVLLQIVLLGVLTLLNFPVILSRLRVAWPVLLLPALAVMSTFWSDEHAVSLRYSIQLMMTYYTGIAIAASMTVRNAVGAVYVGSFIIAVGSFLVPRQGASAEGLVLIGLTGSKNQIGYLAQLMFVAAPLIALDPSRSRAMRWSVAIALPVALRLLVGAHSATATLTAIGGAALIVGMILVKPLPPAGRVAALVAIVLMASPFVILKDTLIEAAQSVSAHVFNKDATLTGRTILWRQADRLIEEKPILGHGYRALWMGKSVESLGLLRLSHQRDGRGFNFHNTYKELGVDLGRTGDALFILGFGFAILVALYQYLVTGDFSVGFLLVMLGTLAVKTFAELIIAPFYIPVILYALAAAAHPPQAHTEDLYEIAELEPAPA